MGGLSLLIYYSGIANLLSVGLKPETNSAAQVIAFLFSASSVLVYELWLKRLKTGGN